MVTHKFLQFLFKAAADQAEEDGGRRETNTPETALLLIAFCENPLVRGVHVTLLWHYD